MKSLTLWWQRTTKKAWFPWVSVLCISCLFVLTHLYRLQSLPVFADEAIYIRWAQLLQHEPARYVFFALNDGKPPLFIWLLSALLSVFPTSVNAVWIARFASVFIGLAQLWALDAVVRQLQGKKMTRFIAGAIVFTAPFWTFSHRIGLMDGLLTLGITLSFWGLLGLHQTTLLPKTQAKLWRERLSFLVLTAVGWGLALWTKTPALFFAPVFMGMAYVAPFLLDSFRTQGVTFKWLLNRSLWFGAAGLLGLGIFLLLKISPSFGSLFGRSSDFTYSVMEVIDSGGQIILNNILRVSPWISTYLRPELVALSLIAVVASKYRRMHWLFWLTALTFAAPLLILGKTLHPRYFLPVAPFLTLSAAFMIHEAWETIRRKESWEMALVLFVLIGFYLLGSLRFLFFSYYDANQIPFVLHDREQYLTEWSSGHGLAQTRDLIRQKVQEGEYVTVITEGSFGSLPDGLLLYFDRLEEIQSVRIEGLAQYPVKTIPDWAWEAAEDHTTWLVLNEHRNALPEEVMQRLHLEASYTRPYGVPALQVYELRTQIQE